jgi:hypothetical protein
MVELTVTIKLDESDVRFLATNSLERVICSVPFKRLAAKYESPDDYARLVSIASQMWYAFSSQASQASVFNG